MDFGKKYFLNNLFICILILLFIREAFTATEIAETTSTIPKVSSSTTDTHNSTDEYNQSTSITPSLTTTTTSSKTLSTVIDTTYLLRCPFNAICSELGADCIDCKLNHYCTYGAEPTGECSAKPNITCVGERTFTRQYHCRYGYQLDKGLYHCNRASASCTMKKAPLETYFADCHVRDDVLCLGSRTFKKKFPCNLTKGYKWSTALVLSVTLGGFGVDRFYLGLWREGIGKLFSFGGLGVWTLVDVILIAVGYVGPHDGSLYIYPWS